MKKLFLVAVMAVVFSSCIFLEFDDNYEVVGVANWVWWALLIGVVLFVIFGISGSKELKRTESKLAESGKRLQDFKRIGNYVGGHPDINETINNIVISEDEQDLGLYEQKSVFDMPNYIAKIPIKAVTDIQIEDASSIDKKITLGRVLLVGVFALAWRKNKKIEHSFVTITWKDGQFEHQTIFSFEGKEAITKANTARNEIIKMCRD